MENSQPIVELDLYIIRHGESMCNAGYGREDITFKEGQDPVLTEKGIAQAVAAGEFLKDISFDEFYASPMLRAARTATEIMKSRYENLPLHIMPELCEVGVHPDYKGVEIDEIREFAPNAVYAEGTDTAETRMRYDTHEENDKVNERARFVIDYLRTRYKSGEKVVLVSHAAFITNLVFVIMSLDKQAPAFDIDYNNTGITRVTYYKPGTYKWGDTVFRYINSTAHYSLMK
ncbi:MAG: histidine phosphatase family protein [Clostridia bacterium]|nr:histidine phosphatase family protein [Clostridia bacterium]